MLRSHRLEAFLHLTCRFMLRGHHKTHSHWHKQLRRRGAGAFRRISWSWQGPLSCVSLFATDVRGRLERMESSDNALPMNISIVNLQPCLTTHIGLRTIEGAGPQRLEKDQLVAAGASFLHFIICHRGKGPIDRTESNSLPMNISVVNLQPCVTHWFADN